MMVAIRSMVAGVCAAGLAACSDATGPDFGQEIELLVDVDPALELPAAPASSLPVAVGLFMTVPASPYQPPIAPAVVRTRAGRVLEDANEIFSECGLHLVAESVQVIGVPPHLLSVQGNELGSWGGHPPDGAGDPDLFTYEENERLTDESRELFSWGKQNTSRNAIAIFVVETIEYYIGEEPTPAGGLSFPPVAYHHADDYPVRNSVLVKQGGRDPTGLPLASARVVVHELGHMLLNTGDHATDTWNVDACDRMRANREWLFGDEAVPDPGPPDVL